MRRGRENMPDNIKIIRKHDKCHCFALIHIVSCTVLKTNKMKNETIKIGDKVSWTEQPQVQSTVDRIERSSFTDVKMYICTNGCRFQIEEITKA